MTFPCAEGHCPAIVAVVGTKCPIHQKAHQGPYSTPCERCGKKIEARHLWVRAKRRDRADDVAYPWHWPECAPGRKMVGKLPKTKKNWTTGLGLYEERK